MKVRTPRKKTHSWMAIFRGKDRSRSRPASMTKEGYHAFEAARAGLAALVGRKANQVSDADTIEALARGEENTIDYLKGTGQYQDSHGDQ